MPKFTPVRPEKLIKILQQKGFLVDHVTGSHFILLHAETRQMVVVPQHKKEVKLGLLKAVLKQADISPTEYEILRKKRKY